MAKTAKTTKKAPKKAIKVKKTETARKKPVKTTKVKTPTAPRPKKKPVPKKQPQTIAETVAAIWKRQASWLFGLLGGPLIIAFLIWKGHAPVSAPAPVQLEARTAETVPQAQVTSSPPAPERPAAPPAVAQVPVPTEFSAEFEKTKDMDLGQRVAFWSALLVKESRSSERLMKISQAPQITDPAPLIPSRFDCTTFVETVSSLARSHKPDEFFTNLLAIRYRQGRATYTNRNHFPEADWLPNNTKAGIIEDVTQAVAQDSEITARNEVKEIHRSEWLVEQVRTGKVSRSIASTFDAGDERYLTNEKVTVPYLPIKDMNKFISHIPNGTIVNLVRRSDKAHPVLISHQGFIVHEGNEVLLRHATPGGKISSIRLKDYLEKIRYQDLTVWPVIGLNLIQLKS